MNIKILSLMTAIAVMAFGCVENKRDTLRMVTGSYAPATDEGIAIYDFDQESGRAERVGGLAGVSNPSFLCLSKDGKRIYSVGEDEGNSSTVNMISVEGDSLRLVESMPTGGGAPCFVNLSPDGKYVLTANYLGGNITIYRLDSDGNMTGLPHIIEFPDADHPTASDGKPRLHSVNFTPDGKMLVAADLGTDRLHLFDVTSSDSILVDPTAVRRVEMKHGMGPRHMDFSADGRYAYVIGELSGEVAVMEINDSTMTPVQYIASDSVGGNGSGDIHLSPDGLFLYSSNRLKADGIAIFSVNKESGKLTRVGYCPTGIHPRNFAITPDGKYLLAACRDDNRIELYRRDAATGLLERAEKDKDISQPRPVCVRWFN